MSVHTALDEWASSWCGNLYGSEQGSFQTCRGVLLFLELNAAAFNYLK